MNSDLQRAAVLLAKASRLFAGYAKGYGVDPDHADSVRFFRELEAEYASAAAELRRHQLSRNAEATEIARST